MTISKIVSGVWIRTNPRCPLYRCMLAYTMIHTKEPPSREGDPLSDSALGGRFLGLRLLCLKPAVEARRERLDLLRLDCPALTLSDLVAESGVGAQELSDSSPVAPDLRSELLRGDGCHVNYPFRRDRSCDRLMR